MNYLQNPRKLKNKKCLKKMYNNAVLKKNEK